MSLSEKFASYYGNLRGLLLGSNLTGRRAANLQDNPFTDEAQLTSYKKESKDNKEGTESSVYVINLTRDIKHQTTSG